jgi:Cys-rich protein (TIGR01571 family)
MSEQPTEVKEQPAPQPTTETQPASQPQPVAQPQGQFLAKHRAVTGSQEWSDGLFDCFHDSQDNLCTSSSKQQVLSDANRSTGLKGWCCPCFVYGKTQSRLRNPSLAGYESFNNDCLIFCGTSYCALSWLYVSLLSYSPYGHPCSSLPLHVRSQPNYRHSLIFLKRGELREKYNIKGNVLEDCFLTCCCPCCSLIQNEKEVIHQNAVAKPEEGYRAPQGMTTGN